MNALEAAQWALAGTGGLTVAIAGGVGYLARVAAREAVFGDAPDPLAHVYYPPEPTDDPTAVPVAVDVHGYEVTLPLLGNHVLVAGVTGSGKGSVIWSIVCGIAPLLPTGHLRIWGIDLKGGMELGIGEDLFDQFVTDPLSAAILLERAVESMERRAARLARDKKRSLELEDLSPADPLVVIVVDELASVTADAEPDIRKRAERALRHLIRMGRAMGICVVTATQDPRMEVLAFRSLFPMRVALRTAEATEADMVLGRGALDRGAATHRISRRTPGVGYIQAADGALPRRVRFAYYTDDKIAAVAQRYTQEAA